MKILKHTFYPHKFDSSGRYLARQCVGVMQVVLHEGRVFTRCNVCGCGYQFHYIIGGRSL